MLFFSSLYFIFVSCVDEFGGLILEAIWLMAFEPIS